MPTSDLASSAAPLNDGFARTRDASPEARIASPRASTTTDGASASSHRASDAALAARPHGRQYHDGSTPFERGKGGEPPEGVAGVSSHFQPPPPARRLDLRVAAMHTLSVRLTEVDDAHMRTNMFAGTTWDWLVDLGAEILGELERRMMDDAR